MPNTQGQIASTASLEHALAAANLNRSDRATRRARISPLAIAGIAGAIELVALVASGFLTAVAWVGHEEALSTHYVAAIVATALAAVVISERAHLYSVMSLRTPIRHLWQVAMAWITAVGLLLGAMFLSKFGDEFSRVWLTAWLATGFCSILAARMVDRTIVSQLSAQGRLSRRAVIYGAGEAGAKLVAQLKADCESDVQIVGIFDDRGIERIPDTLKNYPLLGNIDQLIAFCRSDEVDLLILSLPVRIRRRMWGF